MSDEVWAQFEEMLKRRATGSRRWAELDPDQEHYHELNAFVDALRKIEQESEERQLQQQAANMGCVYDRASQLWLLENVTKPLTAFSQRLCECIEAEQVLRARFNDQASQLEHLGAIVLSLQKAHNPQEVAK